MPDNGFSGYIVILSIPHGSIVHMTQYPRDNAKELYDILERYKPEYAAIEQPFMGRGFAHVSSTNYEIAGRYMQCFEMLDIKYELVRPATWRKQLGIKAKGREEQKKASIDAAQRLFEQADHPLLKSEWRHIVDHKRVSDWVFDDNKCESALIALYALKKYEQITRETQKTSDNKSAS